MYKFKSVNKNKFNLYLLEEGEVYIKEYIVQYLDNNLLVKNGVLYLCSRSFIIESNDKNKPIEKYMFKNLNKWDIIDEKNNKFTKNNNNNNNICYDQFKIKIINYFDKYTSIANIETPYEQVNEPKSLEISLVYDNKIDSYKSIVKVIELFKNKADFDTDSLNILDLFYKFKFDYTRIESINEYCILKQELRVNRIIPLIEIPGLFMITNLRLYYQPIYVVNSKRSYSINMKNILHIYRRRIKLLEVGIEIIYTMDFEEEENLDNTIDMLDTIDLEDNNSCKRHSLLIEFQNTKIRESTIELIKQQLSEEESEKITDNIKLGEATKNWVNGKMSNYDYLILLNSASNRTRNNLSQYPIFPWILTNYTDFELDLNNPDNYRDLSKPIGKLTKKRFDSFLERYHDMCEPKYLYGTHYSTPAYVISYLVRKYPHFMIKLQGGKFDHPDRLFSSLAIDWDICLTNPGSLKELIPEFYEYDVGFLRNDKNLSLKLNNNGDVALPKWAKNTLHFLKTMREALESKIVSSQLHNWIDLIFGYKQRGKEAIKADNLFHPLTYEVVIDDYSDIRERKSVEVQVTEYGQAPKQIFTVPHPKRYSNEFKFFDYAKLTLEYNKEIYNSDKEVEKSMLRPFEYSIKKYSENSQNSLDISTVHISSSCNNNINKPVNENMHSLSSNLNTYTKVNFKSVENKVNDLNNLNKEKSLTYFESLSKHSIYSNKDPNVELSAALEERSFTKLEKFHKSKITALISVPDKLKFNESNNDLNNNSSNLVVGSDNGFIKVYDNNSNKLKQLVNISKNSNFLISCIGLTSIPNQVAIASNDLSIYLYNISLAKIINKFQAHEDTISIIKSYNNSNILVTAGLDCCYKFWDTNYKMPISTYYDNEDKIISGDIITNSSFNSGLFMCLDTSGCVVFRPVNHQNEYIKIKLHEIYKSNRNQEYKFAKFSNTNSYHYYISSSKSFKLFDIRNFKEVDSNDNFFGFIDLIDTSKFLLTNTGGSVSCYKYNNNMISTMELVKDYSICNSSCMAMNEEKDIFIGCNNGDLYISMYRNYDLNYNTTYTN